MNKLQSSKENLIEKPSHRHSHQDNQPAESEMQRGLPSLSVGGPLVSEGDSLGRSADLQWPVNATVASDNDLTNSLPFLIVLNYDYLPEFEVIFRHRPQ